MTLSSGNSVGCGFRLLADRTVVRATGDDRVAFFHGITSNDLKGAEPGSILPVLLLTEHAHVIGDLFVWCGGQALMLDVAADSWPAERAHIDRLLVADDVELEELPQFAVLYLEGAAMLEALGIDGASGIEAWRFIESGSLMIGRMARFGADAYCIIGEGAALGDFASRLQREGFRLLGEDELEITRVENGIARAGVDTAEKTIALEARLDRAISFAKGCYLGQETIERATARGGLKKRLYGLLFARQVDPGAALMLDGREIGHVSSSVVSPKFGPIGLSIIHHSAWKPGLRVDVIGRDGDSSAVVSEIPFRQI